jgi:uncharacterized repeat protein (TIGR03803 family)
VLYRFQGGSDGSDPLTDLIADREGALYGTTQNGGSNANCFGFPGCGTVFQLTPARDKTTGKTTWTESVLYRFQGGSDGFFPVAGLIADREGTLYGTTQFGNGGNGTGTVFQLTPARDKTTGKTTWTESVLYNSQGGSAALIADSEGALYGTTAAGGSGGTGTVFQLTPARDKTTGKTTWTEKVLYSFRGGSDGAPLSAGLIADKEGALFGTTFSGGSGSGGNCIQGSQGCGTVFQLTPARDKTTGKTTWTEKVLYSFRGGSDGALLSAGLIADKEGALFGTTFSGGSGSGGNCFGFPGCGTVFQLTPAQDKTMGKTTWTEKVLYSFQGGSDGIFPEARLIADREGALYGTTHTGGTAGSGTVFKLDLCPK